MTTAGSPADEPALRGVNGMTHRDQHGRMQRAGGLFSSPRSRHAASAARLALVGQMERELVAEPQVAHRGSRCARRSPSVQSLPGPLAIQESRHLRRLSARQPSGASLGRRLGCHPAELRHRRRAWAALCVYLGDLQPVTAIFYGVSPAVIALILHSCYRLAKLGMEDWLQWAIAAVCLAVTVILQAEVALLFIGAGIVGILLLRRPVQAHACRVHGNRAGAGAARAARPVRLDPRQAVAVLPQGRLAYIRSGPRHRAVPAARVVGAIWLAR